MSIYHFALLAIASLATSHHSGSTCKPVFGSPDWPSVTAWDRLNDTVYGRLVAPFPPGAVCHVEQPQYNNASCATLANQWISTSFHAINPVSADYNDVSCIPDATQPCSPLGYPRYVVEAISAADIQQAVTFAAETGVRLIVKGTGHDFLGRSSGSDSISIHTNGIRGLVLHANDPRAISYGGSASLKIFAGERMRDIYSFAAYNNITVVGGADLNVGIGGWIAFGGHSPISAQYGLGADQVLEMDVVTADGIFRTVDENNHPDLFWALRGGGGSSFAILVSVTMKVYPPLPYTLINYSFNTTSDSETFWSLTAYLLSQVPRLADAGLMGYHYPIPMNPDEKNGSIRGKLKGSWYAPMMSQSEVEALLAPMNEHIHASNWGDRVFAAHTGVSGNAFSQRLVSAFPAQNAGIPARLGSRLLDRRALSKPFNELKSALKRASGLSAGLHVFVVAGNGVRQPVGGVPGGSNAVLPAWRSTYAHVVIPYTWSLQNRTIEKRMRGHLRENATQALVELAPDTGAYGNEADPTEHDWQNTFYGLNYEKLLETKRKWDSKGIFWYKNGVGSEDWEPRGQWGIENGVGQNPVQLCKQSGWSVTD